MKPFIYKFIKWGIIPLGLIIVWTYLTFNLINNTAGLTILEYGYQRNNFISWKDTELLKGQKIDAEFKAKANNLGIVAARFNTHKRINSDILIFRLKEKGQQNWSYENKYRVDQFQPDDLFTFGFPIIENSESKIYQFELESTKGQPDDAIALSPVEPVFVTKYQYTKHALLANKNTLKEFIFRKIKNLITDKNFIFSSLVYFLPLVYYFLWLIFIDPKLDNWRMFIQKRSTKYINKHNTLKKIAAYISSINLEKRSLQALFFPFLVKNTQLITDISSINFAKKSLQVLLFFFIGIDILIINEVSHIAIIIIVALWVFMLNLFKFNSRVSYIIAFCLLLLCPLLLIINLQTIAEKAALWSYMFLLVGVVHQMLEIRKVPNKHLKTK